MTGMEHVHMIKLTRLNKTQFVLNADLIETVEENPDTIIKLTDGKILIVSESVNEVVERSIRYYRSIYTK